MATVHTIGHSTRTLEELIAALKAHRIQTLVDIRAFPMSRRLPHFNRESLELELPENGIAYVWMKELGGRRRKILNDSPNTGLRNDSFRNYADYMLTDAFAQAIERLSQIVAGNTNPSLCLKSADDGRAPGSLSPPRTTQDQIATPEHADGSTVGGTAIMCAEWLYFQCHRMLVSDYLTAHGHTVLHIEDDKRPVRIHKLMAEAHLSDGKVIYNAQQLF
jgi:uncharacterized protein (DUF488 family)